VLDRNPAALIVEALGAGHVPLQLAPLLKAAAQQIPVVLTSRVCRGEVYRDTYAFEGSERDLLGSGLLWGSDLPANKARILVELALAMNWPPDRIASALARGQGASA
jgi:L-asparaginase